MKHAEIQIRLPHQVQVNLIFDGNVCFRVISRSGNLTKNKRSLSDSFQDKEKLQSLSLVCSMLLEKKKKTITQKEKFAF